MGRTGWVVHFVVHCQVGSDASLESRKMAEARKKVEKLPKNLLKNASANQECGDAALTLAPNIQTLALWGCEEKKRRRKESARKESVDTALDIKSSSEYYSAQNSKFTDLRTQTPLDKPAIFRCLTQVPCGSCFITSAGDAAGRRYSRLLSIL